MSVAGYGYPVAERTSVPLEPDDHLVPVGQPHPFAEAQPMGTEEMHVYVARAPVPRELEMVMLQVGN